MLKQRKSRAATSRHGQQSAHGRLAQVGLILVMLAVLAFGWMWAFKPHGRYLSTVSVTFASPYPTDARDPFTKATNPLASQNKASLIRFAGITARGVSGLQTQPETVSGDITLLDAGEYDAWSVIQPNVGGQWSYSFSEPGMRVQASGASADAAVHKVDATVARIRAYVNDHENASQVASSARISILVRPDPASAVLVSGSRVRALAGMLVLSLLSVLTIRLVLRRPTPTHRL